METVVLDNWPPSGEELILVVRGLFYFEFVSKHTTLHNVMSELVAATTMRKAQRDQVVCDANFKAANNPLKIHQELWRAMKRRILRHTCHGVARVEAVSVWCACGCLP